MATDLEEADHLFWDQSALLLAPAEERETWK